jgi:ribosome-binding protein aMBF1 (putative translation factor)
MTLLEERIRKARRQACLSQVELSRHLGVTDRTIKRFEKDASKVAVTMMTKISHICEVNEVWLLTGQGKMALKGAE